MRRTALAALSLCWTLAACAGGGTTNAGPAPRGNMNVITTAEIEAASPELQTAQELIQRLRPTMLRPRNLTAGDQGAGTTFGVVVYAGEVRLGGIDELNQVMRGTIREIRYINPSDATTRWGTGHSHGVIQVLLR